VAPLRRSGAGLYVPIRDWLLYADHGLASMCRSRGGSIVPIINWLQCAGRWHPLPTRSEVPFGSARSA